MARQTQEALVVETVLIVDDSRSIRAELRRYLTNLGYQVVSEASDGIEAIDAYVRFKPSFVTLDLVMPQLDGLSALREIRRYDPQAKVIIISSSFNQKIRAEAEELGVMFMLKKPINERDLKEALLKLTKQDTGDKKYG